MDGAVSGQIRRLIVGSNALLLQCALTISSGEGGEEQQQQPELLSIEAMPLAQMFTESYHWTEYALQAVRVRSHLRAAAAAAAAAAASSASPSSFSPFEISSDAPLGPSPLMPLFRAFHGSLFHRLYVQILQGLDAPPADSATNNASNVSGSSKNKKKKNKRKAQAQASMDASAASVSKDDSAAASVRNNAASSVSSTASSSRTTTTDPALAAAAAAPRSFSLFSPSLANALTDLDDSVHDLALGLLLPVPPSASPASAASAVSSMFLSLKRTLWSSVGLPVPASWSTADAPVVDFEAQAAVTAATTAAPPPSRNNLSRPKLPYETWSEASSHHAAPPSTTFFSLCCSAVLPAASSPSTSVSTGAAGPLCSCCGLRGIHVPLPAAAGSDDGEASDAEEGKGKTKSKQKKKRSKTKGKK
jgi:hypothetical protein